jgi:DNA (cytosine-5)-methyltransferase 1
MKYELVNYCEFDKYAKKSYSLIHNESENKNLDDITLVNEKEIADFNMMVGGSPCQDFSVAGKQEGAVWTCKDCKDENGDDYQYNPLEVHYTKRDKCPKCGSINIEKTRSSLVVEWLRILHEKKPNIALYENVKNLVSKKHKYFFDLFIAELHEYGYNTYWKVLNAKDYGIPQNRERVYLFIVKKELDNGKFKFPEGFDSGVRLKDILLKEVDEKYYISQGKTNKLIEQLKSKNKSNDYLPNELMQVGEIDIKGNDCIKRVYSPNGVCPTLTDMQGGNRQPKILEDFYANRDVREYEEYSPTLRADRQGLKVVQGCSTRTRNYVGQPEQLEIRSDELSNSITTVQKDSMAFEINSAESPSPELVGGIGEINFGKQYRQGNRVYDADKTAMCLLSQPVGNTGGYSYLYLVKNDKEAIENISSEYQFAKDKCMEYYNKNGCLPEMFNPYNQAEITDIAPTQTTSCNRSCSSATVLIKDIYYRIRKLTPLECFRLMGFKDEDYYILKNNGISDSQIYKMAGNSIVTDVLYYILLEIYKAMPYLLQDIKLGSFFSGIGAFEKAIIRLQKHINNIN